MGVDYTVGERRQRQYRLGGLGRGLGQAATLRVSLLWLNKGLLVSPFHWLHLKPAQPVVYLQWFKSCLAFSDHRRRSQQGLASHLGGLFLIGFFKPPGPIIP